MVVQYYSLLKVTCYEQLFPQHLLLTINCSVRAVGLIFLQQCVVNVSPIKTTEMARKYSKGAQENVREEMHEFKEGKLKSGSGKKVTNPKQAIAIGLS